MKTILSIIVTMLVSVSVVMAQGGPNGKIQSAKIGMITNRLNLSGEQATQFWPIYNEYEAKKMDIKKSQRRVIAESNTLTATDEKLLAGLKEMNSLKQKEVDIDREYMNKFLKVINARQLFELYKAEQQFTQMLLNRLNKQEGMRPKDLKE